jgi:hypothetical protein
VYQGEHVLHYAARNGNRDVIEFLCDIEPSLLLISSKKEKYVGQMYSSDEFGIPLVIAAARGIERNVQFLFERMERPVESKIERQIFKAFRHSLKGMHWKAASVMIDLWPSVVRVRTVRFAVCVHV